MGGVSSIKKKIDLWNFFYFAKPLKDMMHKNQTRALLRLERTMNLLCHWREGGREGRGGREGEGRGGEGRGGEGDGTGRDGRGGGGRGGRQGRKGEGGRDACIYSLSPRHVERNYVSRCSIVSRRTRVRNYVRRDVDILRHPDSLANKLPELVSKLVLSIPV